MGRVEAFALAGLELWFNSSDHLPPHIHVKRRGEWEIRVFFLLCTDSELAFNRKWGRRDPPAAAQSAIRNAVVEHRAEPLREWEQKVCRPT
ncbi:MAG: DUF4160 domain-containing protein [Bryobacteraceae bacterium]